MSHTSGNILLHLIFSTHQRRPLIKSEFQAELFTYMGGIIREMDGTALIIHGTANHVHMLARIRPAQSAAEIARVVKTKQIPLVGFTRNGVQMSPSKLDTEFSASANPTSLW